jgi:hypothetical protein
MIFSVGVLGVMNLTAALSLRMERAAIQSELSVMGQERLDSLEVMDYDDFVTVPSTDFSTTSVRGSEFYWLIMVTDSTALARHAQVWLLPSSGIGPSFVGSTFVNRSW